jgi:hypothetical protein
VIVTAASLLALVSMAIFAAHALDAYRRGGWRLTEKPGHPQLSRNIAAKLTGDAFSEDGTNGLSSWPNLSGGSAGKV